MHYERAAKLLNSLPDDDLTALVEGLPSRVVNELLKSLSNENRFSYLIDRLKDKVEIKAQIIDLANACRQEIIDIVDGRK